MIADAIEKRLPFRRVMKSTLKKCLPTVMCKVRVYLGGRLGVLKWLGVKI